MYKDEECNTHHKQLFSPRDMVRCWDECLEKSDYHQRLLYIQQFNAHNHWKKRGISIVPLKFGIGFSKGFYNQVRRKLVLYFTRLLVLKCMFLIRLNVVLLWSFTVKSVLRTITRFNLLVVYVPNWHDVGNFLGGSACKHLQRWIRSGLSWWNRDGSGYQHQSHTGKTFQQYELKTIHTRCNIHLLFAADCQSHSEGPDVHHPHQGDLHRKRAQCCSVRCVFWYRCCWNGS